MFYFSVGFGVVFFVIDRIVKDFFSIQPTICNTGIAFGIYIPQWILFIVIGVLLLYSAVLIIKAVQVKDFILIGAVSLIFCGALSNLMDRIIYGCVVDYLYIISHFIWFNISDIAIFMGGILFIIRSFFKKQI